jgi:hypothetical protein
LGCSTSTADALGDALAVGLTDGLDERAVALGESLAEGLGEGSVEGPDDVAGATGLDGTPTGGVVPQAVSSANTPTAPSARNERAMAQR